MVHYRVMVVIPPDKAERFEEALKRVDLVCMHYLKVRGYHGSPNFYANDWSDELAKFELVVASDVLEQVKSLMKEACQTGSEDDGVYSVSPLSEVGAVSDL